MAERRRWRPRSARRGVWIPATWVVLAAEVVAAGSADAAAELARLVLEASEGDCSSGDAYDPGRERA